METSTISILALVVSCISLAWQVKSKSDVATHARFTEYWVKNISIPMFIDPLVHFSKEYVKLLSEIDQTQSTAKKKKLSQALIDKYSNDKLEIANGLFTIGYSCNADLNAIYNQLEESEERITDFCYSLKSGTPTQTSTLEAKSSLLKIVNTSSIVLSGISPDSFTTSKVFIIKQRICSQWEKIKSNII